MYLNKISDYSCLRSVTGLQPSIFTKSLLTWEPLFTSKFDTAANKQCYIYIIISGRRPAWLMNPNAWPSAVASPQPTATVPPCGRLGRQPGRTMKNYLDLKATDPPHRRYDGFYYTATVNIQYPFSDCASYKSICRVMTCDAKYAKHR